MKILIVVSSPFARVSDRIALGGSIVYADVSKHIIAVSFTHLGANADWNHVHYPVGTGSYVSG